MKRKTLKVKDLREFLSDNNIFDEDDVTIVVNGEAKNAVCMEHNELGGELVIEDKSIVDTVGYFNDKTLLINQDWVNVNLNDLDEFFK